MGRERSGPGIDPRIADLGTLSAQPSFTRLWRLARTVQKLRPSDSKQWAGYQRKVEWAVLTCDYNGWNDAPEDEREWFDQHPEIWGDLVRDSDKRPYKVTPKTRRRGGW
jgi:hypothetical protein